MTILTPSVKPNPTPISAPVTPVPLFTKLVTLSENPSFGDEDDVILNYQEEPNQNAMIVDYTFADKNPGKKVLYVQYTSSNGQTAKGVPFPAQIELKNCGTSCPVSPTPVSTPYATTLPTLAPTPVASPAGNHVVIQVETTYSTYTIPSSTFKMPGAQVRIQPANTSYGATALASGTTDSNGVFWAPIITTDPSVNVFILPSKSFGGNNGDDYCGILWYRDIPTNNMTYSRIFNYSGFLLKTSGRCQPSGFYPIFNNQK